MAQVILGLEELVPGPCLKCSNLEAASWLSLVFAYALSNRKLY